MYIFELANIMYFIKSLKTPTCNFNIVDYVTFSSSTIRSSSGSKLIHNFSSNNKVRSFYFNRLTQLWNSISIINLDLSINTIKNYFKQYSTAHIFLHTRVENMRVYTRLQCTILLNTVITLILYTLVVYTHVPPVHDNIVECTLHEQTLYEHTIC